MVILRLRLAIWPIRSQNLRLQTPKIKMLLQPLKQPQTRQLLQMTLSQLLLISVL
nr:MAG TPA: hypothetical protein [Bacteriophage sp.]